MSAIGSAAGAAMMRRNFPRRGLNKRQLSQVKKIVTKNRQYKTVYTSLANQSITNTAPSFFALSTITQSADNEPTERASDYIHAISLRLSFALQSVANAGSTANNQARIMIVRAKAQPLIISDFPTFNGTPNQEEMQIYYDKVHAFGPNVSSSAGGEGLTFNKLIKFKKGKIPHLGISYQDASTTPFENQLSMYIIPASDTTVLQINGYSVLNWYDKV